MTVVVGQQRTDTVPSFQRPVDMSSRLHELEPDAAPFTVLLAKTRKRRAINSTFSWGNHGPESRFGVTTQSRNSSDTTVTVDDGTQYGAEYTVKVPRTGEMISVTSVSTNTLTIERGVGGSTAAAMNSGEQFYILGVAATEGDYSKPPRTVIPTQVTNYTEIFKRSVEASGTERSSSDMFDKHEWDRMVAEQGREHRKDIELAYLFGNPGERTTTSSTSSGKRRTTGGLLNYLTSNNTAIGGSLTSALHRTWMRSLTRYGSKKRTFMAGNVALQAYDSLFDAKLQLHPSDATYNVSAAEWTSSAGTVMFLNHPLLEGTTYAGYIIAIDMADDDLAYRFLNGDGPGGSRDTQLYPNRSANDLDGRRDEYISEVGLEAGNPGLHGVATGITGPA